MQGDAAERQPVPPEIEGTIRLRDDRSIGFAEYGAPDAIPIFWFHATPGGRRQIPPLAREVAAKRGVRLIALERPGIGDSTPHLYDSLLDWADDVADIADRMRIERFAVVGVSGGGPYVLACAYRLPERVVAGAILGGVAPALGSDAPPGGAMAFAASNRRILHSLREPLAYLLWAGAMALRPLAAQAFDQFVRNMPEGDQRVMQRPEMKAMFLDDLMRADRHQLHAPIYDLVLFTRDWGFSPRDIRVPIRFWHGDADDFVPLEHGIHMADLVPDSKLEIRPLEGHMGNLDAAEEIIDALIELWPKQR